MITRSVLLFLVMMGGGFAAWGEEYLSVIDATIPTSMWAIRVTPACPGVRSPRECLIAYVWAFAAGQSGKVEYPKWPRRSGKVYLLNAPGVFSIEQIGKKIVVHIEDTHGVRVRP